MLEDKLLVMKCIGNMCVGPVTCLDMVHLIILLGAEK